VIMEQKFDANALFSMKSSIRKYIVKDNTFDTSSTDASTSFVANGSSSALLVT